MKEQDETPMQEAESHSPMFLKKAAGKASSLKKGTAPKGKKANPFKKYGGK